ncbi:MAG: SusC/RagA family TonB-linked outer membrane protein [Bacteroidetes bacterium]|nr:MAG: SusC/RagA family TonB-linked outer membrane protein [Bacteroidota bacterium]
MTLLENHRVKTSKSSASKRRAHILIMLVPLFCGQISFSQTIKGLITGADHEPLVGASVLIERTNTGTTTDTSGHFSIRAKKGDILRISYIGYKTKEIKLGDKIFVAVSLMAPNDNLDEIIVTGYTSQKLKEITGSVASVKPKDLVAVPAGQVEPMLQGRVAGLTVISSGDPGAPSQVYLHGMGNFGNVRPLYIIDGIEGDINIINPYDIESIQVLKDAAAYSIYGVRGANGVIVLTTKKGKSGKTKLSYDFYVGRQQPLSKGLALLSPQEQADLEWMAFKNSGQTPSDPLYGNGPSPILPDYLFAGPHVGLFKGDPKADPSLYNIDSLKGPIYQIVPFNKAGTDWFHELLKPAWSQNHTLTVSGGDFKNHYLLSFGYLDQQATYLNAYLKRFTTRVNTEFTLMNTIRIGENFQLSYSQNPRVGRIYGDLMTYPLLPVYDIEGNSSGWGPAYPGGFYIAPGPATNPVTARVLSGDDQDHNWRLFGNAYGEFDFLKNFRFRTSFGGLVNYHLSNYFTYGSYEPLPPSANGNNNSFTESTDYTTNWTWTNTLNYTARFYRNNRIQVLVGTEEKSNYYRQLQGTRIGYASNDPNYRFLSTGRPAGQTNASMGSASYLSSFFSQAEYSHREKYFLTATVRRDGSSVFGPESRYGWFPSFGIAWRMTEEYFLTGSRWLTDLKLRASWGKTGFDGNTNPNNQYTLYGGGPGGSYYDINGSSVNIQQGFRPVRFGNAKTSWQEDVVINMGLDGVLWNGKLSITADWYNKKSTGLLFPVLLPALLGEATAPNVNAGDIKNSGIDIKLGSKGNFSKDWNWDLLVTFSHYDNRIVKLNNIPFFDDGIVRNQVGYPIGSFFGYKIIGFFQNDADVAKSPVQEAAKPGRFKYLDANGDGIISDLDRIHFANPNPDFTLGLNIGFGYKNFDFTTFFYGSFGNHVINGYRDAADIFSSGPYPKSKTALYDSWTPQHRDAKAPIQEYDYNFSNAATNNYSLENGSYFRNKTMILGFSFPRNLMQKIKIERLRVYIQVANLFTVTNYSGLDPELGNPYGSSFGIDNGNYPNNQKQWLLGANISF